jgi:hypothetical protein
MLVSGLRDSSSKKIASWVCFLAKSRAAAIEDGDSPGGRQTASTTAAPAAFSKVRKAESLISGARREYNAAKRRRKPVNGLG